MREGGAEPAARLIELRYLDGLRPATIGEMLGLTARQVSARLQRAKKAFRRAWAHRQGRGGRTQATN
jgi:DNA-directed RNA polymerase specialized sigma24 family protein